MRSYILYFFTANLRSKKKRYSTFSRPVTQTNSRVTAKLQYGDYGGLTKKLRGIKPFKQIVFLSASVTRSAE